MSRELYVETARQLAESETERRVLQGKLIDALHACVAPPVVVQPVAPPAPARAEKPRDRITERIEAVSEGDPKVARHFRKLVTKLRKEGQSDGDILPQIKWTSTETES